MANKAVSNSANRQAATQKAVRTHTRTRSYTHTCTHTRAHAHHYRIRLSLDDDYRWNDAEFVVGARTSASIREVVCSQQYCIYVRGTSLPLL